MNPAAGQAEAVSDRRVNTYGDGKQETAWPWSLGVVAGRAPEAVRCGLGAAAGRLVRGRAAAPPGSAVASVSSSVAVPQESAFPGHPAERNCPGCC